MVSVTGRLGANDAAPGGVEVLDPVIEALGEPAQTPPVELWRPTMNAGLPTLLDHAPVTLRHLRQPGRLADRGGEHARVPLRPDS